MSPIAYLKLQAKNLFKDYKSNAPYIEGILVNYCYGKNDFSLMKAQHVIACMVGFSKWTELLKASVSELELAKLLFANRDKTPIEHWKKYISGLEQELGITLDAKSKLEVFQHDFEVCINKGTYEKPFTDYRLNHALGIRTENNKPNQISKQNPDRLITSLPLSKEDRAEFIEVANHVFDAVMWRIVPHNPSTSKLWNAEDYVDSFLTKEMLPISKDYALSLIDSFLVQHVIGLANHADEMAEQSRP